MKTIRRLLIAAFAVVMICSSFVARAAVQFDPLPKFLPIKGTNFMRDWSITNTWISTGIVISHTNDLGEELGDSNMATPHRFSSFQDFQLFLVKETMDTLARMRKDVTASTMLNIDIYVGYAFEDIPYYTMHLEQSSIGTIDRITDEAILNIPMTWLVGIVPITNFVRLEYEVAATPPYAYPTNVAPGYPKQIALTNGVAINSWCADPSTRSRWKITAKDASKTKEVSRRFTQLGAELSPPVVDISDRHFIRVTMAVGSDTTLQTSIDLKHWVNLHTWNWKSNTNGVEVLPLDLNAPHRYCRAFSE